MAFINCSNHTSSSWNQKQIEEAEKWGAIQDYQFPCVDADATEEEVRLMAERVIRDLIRLEPDAVMCQGEFTLTYNIVKGLKKMGIPVVSACSKRITEEEVQTDGSTKKISYFRFVRFRQY